MVFFCGELLFEMAGEGEIDVVAAEEDVFADGDAFQLQLAGFFGDGDEGEVRRASADVDDEDEVADGDALPPIGVAFDPGVEGGLRFFEKDDVGETGAGGGLKSQLAGDGVEGGGDGDEDLLLVERGFGMFRFPGVAEVFEIELRGFDGREFFDAFGRVERKEGRGAVDAGVGEPAFGGGDEAGGGFGAAALGESAGDFIGVAPGEGGGAGGKIVGAGDIEEGGEQGFVANFAGIDELGDGEEIDRRGFEGVGGVGGGGEGEGGIGGAEVDADDELGRQGGLLDFHFGGGEDGRGLRGGERGEVDFHGAPAFVAEDAAGDFAVGGDVAEELDGGGVGGVELGEGAFDGVDDGGEFEVAEEGFAGLAVEIADGGADLIVGVGGDVFHKEVDEAGVALEDAEDLERAVGGGELGFGLGGWFGFFGDVAEGLGDVGGECAGEQDGEEGAERGCDA